MYRYRFRYCKIIPLWISVDNESWESSDEEQFLDNLNIQSDSEPDDESTSLSA
jgi:hypothetical protein